MNLLKKVPNGPVLIFVAAALCGAITGCSHSATQPLAAKSASLPSPSATWPWPGALESQPQQGLSLWTFSDQDGTSLELYRFDFIANRKLHFGLYDQDEDDSNPFDNKADFFANGVGLVTKHLNDTGRGRVLLAWNGLFFAYQRTPGAPPHGWATHIGPAVLDGRMHYNVGQHRWTFGVKYDSKGMPKFKALRLPDIGRLETEFDNAADGAQCLVQNGKPVEPTLAGIPKVDEIKTSRTSIGWSKDSRFLYVLIVLEPDTETASLNELRQARPQNGGWNFADLQRFWTKLGVDDAVNSDGGAETQRARLQKDGSYDLIISQLSKSPRHMILPRGFRSAPDGGSLMTFYVSDRK